jgi:3-hydroxyisobutyrate dehydrogenase-like beta-hydroxyacid dehydrogenase
MAENKKDRVGIVGAGRMGLSMLKHLVKKGYTVTVCDISEKQRDAARAAGAAIVKTPAEVGKASDIVILGVGYDDEVNDVVFGNDGLLAAMAPGSIIAVSSTAKPDTVKALATRVAQKGIEVLDAPICRGRFAADSGTLLALVGGKPDVVARARPVYGTFASDIMHLGDVGHGQVGKTMNNLLLWVNAVGLLEAGRLAETTGIDLVKLREALMMSSGASDVAADHRRHQGTRQGGAPRQGEQSAQLDRQQAGQIRISVRVSLLVERCPQYRLQNGNHSMKTS